MPHSPEWFSAAEDNVGQLHMC